MKRMMIGTMTLTTLLLVNAGTLIAADDREGAAPTVSEVTATEETPQPVIQIALLLDTSNSMDGLIDQAKSELWSIVNELALARYEGERPDIRIALYEYGNTNLSVENGWVRQVQPLTDNLDLISQELFALETNGGDEYCGRVISAAVNDLDWSASPDDLKAIFIAGNEPFTQGGVNWEEACSAAIARGVVINTIFCGSSEEGVQTGWQAGAVRSDGSYMNIDQGMKAVHIDAPQDAEIVRLGLELNETYIPYGREGQAGLARQTAEDANAADMSMGVAVSRQACKGGGLYWNSAWDLVDACKQGSVELASLKEAELPEAMQSMTIEEREAHVDAQSKRRDEIQSRIQTLTEERRVFVVNERARLAGGGEGEDSLDSAVVKIIRELAERKQYSFEQ